MAKRKSNRAARRLLGMRYKSSNRIVISGDKCPIDYWIVKTSLSQRRAKRLVEEMRIERHFEANCLAGLNDDQAWAAAVKTVKG
ncbi:hypothetical protein OQJ40_09070 [Serratia nevei]|uniref:ribosome hibernation factor SRA n=1 Tax=Serratia nevei TaxID=2703794 RepID=UPI0027D25786|nr:30S ribosomal protein subunit S22 family protein [Serratia nevei]MDR8481958.1 hypothetical protein [Serratia nevei]WMC77235.1 hypothetical protein O8I25_08850 [Serratia nevei]WMC82692.1 hypothetical protein O8I24_09070 [Serratia nevei]